MPLPQWMFREERGFIEKVKESQRRRNKDPAVVDEIAREDAEWRKICFERDNMKKELNAKSKQVGEKKKAGEDTTALQAEIRDTKSKIEELDKAVEAKEKAIQKMINVIGNLVHDSVPFSNDEDNNQIVRTWGECKQTGTERHHHELMTMIDGYSPQSGVNVAGHRAYFLKGVGVLLNQALINYGLRFLMERKYVPLQPPYFMNKPIMAETAQLEQFDEELYKVIGTGSEEKEEDSEKYLIATSEQPISAYHRGEWLNEEDLPLRYAGFSSCFRKEAGSHGRDAWGIFRVHQFEKVEQFVITEPEKSWEMHEEMIAAAEDFYKSLNIPYRVVNIVSGTLNNAAAKKYDLEAWFPTLGVFRELVSCSNCTDYQARAMETRCGQAKQGERDKKYVHMLNATLTATERTICCILENYQTPEGVVVPEVLRPYMGGQEFIKFVRPPPENKAKAKTEQKKK